MKFPPSSAGASLRSWGQDRLLRRVVRNSSYLFASNAISAILSIVTANLLGVAAVGALGGIIGFVSNVNRLLSFRMGDVVVKYVGESLALKDPRRAAAVIKAAGLTEGLTSLLAFAVLWLLAPLGARLFTGGPAYTSLVLLYGISILGNITTETATGILQVSNHYRSQALVNLAQAVLTAILIISAAVQHQGIQAIVTAYLVGKMILGLGPILLALFWLPRLLGGDWWRAPLSLLPPRREFVRFAINTNIFQTVNMVGRDSEVLWINALLSVQVGGYYKTALALINLIILPITPFINTSFPEITRFVATGAWSALRTLLRRVTVISAGWTLAVAVGLLLVGRQVLFTGFPVPWGSGIWSLYKAAYLPTFPVLLVMLVGYGFSNIFFWNRSLLLAFGQSGYPLWVNVAVTVVKVLLSLALVPQLGYLTEACLLSGYFLAGNGLVLWRGWRSVRKAEQVPPVEGGVSG